LVPLNQYVIRPFEVYTTSYATGNTRRCAEFITESAAICGECFKPLAPSDGVTMEGRKVGRRYWVRVPVCSLLSIGGIKHWHCPCVSGCAAA
jgi:hypothetical protein